MASQIIDPLSGKMYWCISTSSINFLVPKKRGKGFLRQPVGHHVNNLSIFVADELGCDCVGLEGALSLEIGFTHGREKELTEMANKLAEHLGVELVKVSHTELHKFLESNF